MASASSLWRQESSSPLSSLSERKSSAWSFFDHSYFSLAGSSSCSARVDGYSTDPARSGNITGGISATRR